VAGRPRPAGAMGRAPPPPAYVEPLAKPELYIELLVSARARAGEGIGAQLVLVAERAAAERGAAVLRVDCWAGAPGLVSWYERQGFVRTATYEARGKTGQVFEKPVGARQASGAARSGGVPRSRSPPTGAGVQRGEGMGRG
jgi:hypothetical protein